MGRKSKLRKSRRQQKQAFQPSNGTKDLNILTIDINDDNWLFQQGDVFDPNSKILARGSLDTCINSAYAKIPTLHVEPRESMKQHCGEYGMCDGGGWHIIYQPLAAMSNQSLRQNDMTKIDSAIAAFNSVTKIIVPRSIK
jgi:hypothetical protein